MSALTASRRRPAHGTPHRPSATPAVPSALPLPLPRSAVSRTPPPPPPRATPTPPTPTLGTAVATTTATSGAAADPGRPTVDTWEQYYRVRSPAERAALQPRRAHECLVCHTLCVYRSDVQAHILAVHCKHAPHRCDECGKTMSTRYKLTRHRRSHTKEKPFRCSLCPSAFPHNEGLRWHLKNTHAQDKEHACTYWGCAYRFGRESDLARHVLTHTNERQHECHGCHQRFPRADALRRHQASSGRSCASRYKRKRDDAALAHFDPWAVHFDDAMSAPESNGAVFDLERPDAPPGSSSASRMTATHDEPHAASLMRDALGAVEWSSAIERAAVALDPGSPRRRWRHHPQLPGGSGPVPAPASPEAEPAVRAAPAPPTTSPHEPTTPATAPCTTPGTLPPPLLLPPAALVPPVFVSGTSRFSSAYRVPETGDPPAFGDHRAQRDRKRRRIFYETQHQRIGRDVDEAHVIRATMMSQVRSAEETPTTKRVPTAALPWSQATVVSPPALASTARRPRRPTQLGT